MLESRDLAELPDGYGGPIEVTNREELEEVFRFRAKVWAEEEDWLTEKPSPIRICDCHDGAARHWVVRHRELLVAAVRLSLHDKLEEVPDHEYFPKGFTIEIPPPIASVNKVVVARAHRRQGIGAALDRLAVHVARQSGANVILELVPPYRVHGLCKLGFKVAAWTHYPYTGDIPATLLLLDLSRAMS